MLAKYIVVASLIALSISPCGAAETEPIDSALQTCLAQKENETTAGMVECYGKAYAAWDKELNRTYDQLSRSLDPASRDRLRAAQRQWVAFRDADTAFQRQEFIIGNGKYGTLTRVTLIADNVDMVRKRVMTLRTYANPD